MLSIIPTLQSQIATVLPLRLTVARTAKKYSQEFAAHCIGISSKSISSYENGKAFPPIQVLGSLAYVYEVSIDWLCGTTSINNSVFNLAQMENSASTLASNIDSLKKLLNVDTSAIQVTYEIKQSTD